MTQLRKKKKQEKTHIYKSKKWWENNHWKKTNLKVLRHYFANHYSNKLDIPNKTDHFIRKHIAKVDPIRVESINRPVSIEELEEANTHTHTHGPYCCIVDFYTTFRV